MDDLVKRLRATCSCNIDNTPCLAEEECRVAQEAADRIEELEAENKLLNEQMDAIEEMGTDSLNALPDLLEALELADAALSGANMNMTVVARKVRAAIAKARGEGQ
jgi:predicted nuclease with TOPRIM domain